MNNQKKEYPKNYFENIVIYLRDEYVFTSRPGIRKFWKLRLKNWAS